MKNMLRASVTLPDDLLKEAKAVSGNNLSALVAEALRKYLKDAKTKKALKSFGSWKNIKEDSVDIVNDMRDDKGRNYADRDN
jgi:metal-responsive CopG/Arc/MetJ family transcriptional regulator